MDKSKIIREREHLIFPDGQKLGIDIIKKANKRSKRLFFIEK